MIKYYQKELGDKVLAGRVMVIDEKAANNLLNKYEPNEEEKMTREEMRFFARLDEAVDRIADGHYTTPSESMPKYNIKSIVMEAERLGRPFTNKKVKIFQLYKLFIHNA
ncbi:hypothetical protein SUT328_05230 [Streptococcus parasuis]|nr:hypothetical protein SUT380_05280 [Streptococcus parasuis]GIC29419.1 hypothetical protein SUT328_05230 [Streptococcus parasuis]